MVVLDIHRIEAPKEHSSNGMKAYPMKLVWGALHYIEGTFYANALSLLIEEIYKEQLSSKQVSIQLKKLAELGYIKRTIASKAHIHHYKYTRTDRAGHLIRKNWRVVGG